MRIGICDDTAIDKEQLCGILRSYFIDHTITYTLDAFSTAQALLASWSPGKYQILFLDIIMPHMTGMQAAQIIRQGDPACALIFTTTSVDYALESYEVYAAGYLLKPYTRVELDEVLDWCLGHMSSVLQTIDVVSEREHFTLPLQDIILIEIFGRKSQLYTHGQEYSTNRSLGELESALSSDFLRCHRSFLINMNHVVRLRQSDFLLTDGRVAPISADMSTHVKQVFFEFMFRHTWERR